MELGSDRARRTGIGTIPGILDFRFLRSAALEDDDVQGVLGRTTRGMKVV